MAKFNANLEHLTIAQVARLLNLSDRQVYNLVNRAVFAKHGQRKQAYYVWNEVLDGYLADKLAQLRPAESKQDADNLAEAELRRTNADAKLKELKAAELEGNLVPVDWVIQTETKMNSAAKTRILGIPSDLARSMPAEHRREVKSKAERICKQACMDLQAIVAKTPEIEMGTVQ